MASTVADLAERLVAQGVGTLNGTIFRGLLPDAPDTALAVTEYAGEPPRLKAPGSLALDERPRAQIVARAPSYQAAEALARAAYEAVQCAFEVLGGSLYARIDALQTPFFFKQDERGRVYIAFNVTIRRFN